MKSTLQDIFEFKISHHFLAPTIAIYKKKLAGFYSNSLHCKFEFTAIDPLGA